MAKNFTVDDDARIVYVDVDNVTDREWKFIDRKTENEGYKLVEGKKPRKRRTVSKPVDGEVKHDNKFFQAKLKEEDLEEYNRIVHAKGKGRGFFAAKAFGESCLKRYEEEQGKPKTTKAAAAK